MIDGKSVLGLITARGGSKSVPGKNLKPLGGKPLIAWIIAAARDSQYLDRLVLSTDDGEISAAAGALGCEVPFMRPGDLSGDEAKSIDAVNHALETLVEKYDYVALMQPTSPFTLAEDIDNCVRLCHRQDAPACVAVSETAKSPYWMYHLDDERMRPVIAGNDQRVTRRQELPATYVSGGIFVARCNWIISQQDFIGPDTLGCIVNNERALDVDTELDFATAEALLNRMTNG